LRKEQNFRHALLDCAFKQFFDFHWFFGGHSCAKGWREAMRSVFTGEVEIPHKQRNRVFEIVQFL
jgi:hypothetical protein